MADILIENRAITEAALTDAAVKFLRDRVPPKWEVRVEQAKRDVGDDALLRITDPSGVSVLVVVEVKRTIDARSIKAVADKAKDGNRLLVARYLAPSARQEAAGRGLSYLDATGNSRITLTRPGLWIETTGATDDPWRGRGRPTTTLRGAPATKIARLLLDTRGPWNARQIADQAAVSIGSVYRALDYLDSEALIERQRGRVTVPDWVRLLRAWAEQQQFLSANTITRWIAPRGLDALIDRIARAGTPDGDYAITGSLAVPEAARYAPARNAMIYVRDPARAAQQWRLRSSDTGINVLLAEPRTDVPFTRLAPTSTGLALAAPAQVACDLLNGPGRAPAEAEELITWMEQNESAWRI